MKRNHFFILAAIVPDAELVVRICGKEGRVSWAIPNALRIVSVPFFMSGEADRIPAP